MTSPTSTARSVALDHYADRRRFSELTAQAMGGLWAEVDPNRIAASWAELLPQASAMVAGAQLGAARSADSYVSEVLDAQDINSDAVATVDPSAFANTTGDGRPLLTLLSNPAVVTLLAIEDGMDVARALGIGGANARMLASTMVADAGRLADQVAITTRPAASGYVRIAAGATCSRCMVLIGRIYPYSTGFQRHPQCDCQMIPVANATAAQMMQDARGLYDRMTDAQRLRAGFTRADIRAIADGADLEAIINARTRPGALFSAGGRRFTREGTTRRSLAGKRLGAGRGQRVQRFTVDEIYRQAGGNREEALRLLYDHGYLLTRPVRRADFDLAAALPSGRAATPAAAVTLRPGLTRARSIRAVEAEFVQEYLRITGKLPVEVHFVGSIETAKEHAEGILRGLERFPDANMTVVSTTTQTGVYAVSVGNRVEFAEDWSRNRNRYTRALAGDVEDGFHPPGTGTPMGVAIHEFGHSIDLGTLGQRIHAQVNDVVARIANELGLDPERVIEVGISRYATKNTRELVAEAFVDVMVNGQRASRLSREIFDLLEAEYRTSGRRIGVSLLSATAPDLRRMTVVQLRAMAKDRGIRGYSRMRKDELVQALTVDSVEIAARAEIALMARFEGRAEFFSEILELVGSEASKDALRQRIRSAAARLKIPAATREAMLRAVDRDLIEAVARSAKRAGLEQIGEAARPARFSRATHQAIAGERIREGAPVLVVRPGFSAMVNGQRVVIRRPIVEEITEAEFTRLDPALRARREQVRQQFRTIQEARKTSNAVVDIEQALSVNAADDVLRQRIGQLVAVHGAPEKLAEDLLAAMPDRTAVRRVLNRYVRDAGLKPVGTAGRTVRFDPRLHEAIDGVPIPEGTMVRVVRRGFQAGDAATAKAIVEVPGPVRVVRAGPGSTIGDVELGPTALQRALGEFDVVRPPVGDFADRPFAGVVSHRGQPLPPGFRSRLEDIRRGRFQIRPGLTVTESQALDRYVLSRVADPINTALRQGFRSGFGTAKIAGEIVDLDEVARFLDDAIDAGELTNDTILYRGSLMRPVDLRKLQVGAVTREDGFLSTTTSVDNAFEIINWRKGMATGGRSPVIFRIHAPKGTKAAIAHTDEREVLLARGRRMRVVNIVRPTRPGGTRFIDLELLPDAETAQEAVAAAARAATRAAGI